MAEFLPRLSIKPVTGSAFSIARYKIKSDFFRDFCHKTIKEILRAGESKYWKGYRLLAGDGTTISLPVSKNIIKHFGIYAQTSCGTKTVMANACMLYDVMTNFVVGAAMATTQTSEFSLIQDMLNNKAITNSILILDRGFSKFYFYKMLIEQGITFCIRQKTGGHSFSQQVLNNPENDFITEWYPSEAERATCNQKGVAPLPIKVRVTKVVLPCGEIELLISNLFDREQITLEDLKELYHFRWSIEESFKFLKPQMKLEQFGCKKAAGVYQEFYAHIIMMNITTLIANLSGSDIEKRTRNRKYKYKYNRVNAWKFVRNKIIELYSMEHIGCIIEQLLQQISKSIIAIVPGRSFPRNHKFKRKNRFSPVYK